MRSQSMQLVIPLSLHRLAASQRKPAGDNIGVRHTFELRRGGVCPPDNTHVINRIITHPTIVILSRAKNLVITHVIIRPTIVILSGAKNLVITHLTHSRSFTSFRMTKGVGAFGRMQYATTVICKQFVFINIDDVILRHHERTPSQILHARIIIRITQLLTHPLLRRHQIHPIGNDEKQPKPLGRRRYMRQHYKPKHILHAQLLTFLHPILTRIRQMVDVVHRKSRRNSVRIQPATVLKRSMRRKNRTAHLLQSVRNLCANIAHQRRAYRLPKQFRCALPHLPTTYVI